MSARQRFIVGGSLLVACVVLIVIGGELWSAVTSDIHTRERLHYPCPALAARDGGCLGPYQTFATGFRPNHVPAILAFVFGGGAGLLGIILVRSRSTPAMRGRLLKST